MLVFPTAESPRITTLATQSYFALVGLLDCGLLIIIIRIRLKRYLLIFETNLFRRNTGFFFEIFFEEKFYSLLISQIFTLNTKPSPILSQLKLKRLDIENSDPKQ